MGENQRRPFESGIVWSRAKTGIVVVLAILIIVSAVFALTMIVSVGVGHAVVLVDPISKSISDPVLGPTFAVKMPWVNAVDIYYATDSYEAVVPSFSSDQLEMNIEVLVRWSLDTSKIKDLYSNYPNMNYKVAIESVLEETMRLITKEYTATETIEKRDIVRDQIETSVLEELQSEESLAGALRRLEFDLKDIGYPEKYTASIEDKLVAQQQQIQAEFEKQKILILANATAQETIITASGEAEAKVIEANATREAIVLVLESVGQSGNETRIAELYLWVEALQRIAPDIEILIVGTDGVPVLIPSDYTSP